MERLVWIIKVGPMNYRGPCKKEASESEGAVRAKQRLERREGAMLLAVKMEEGAMSRGIEVTFSSRKGQEKGSFPKASQGSAKLLTPRFQPSNPHCRFLTFGSVK